MNEAKTRRSDAQRNRDAVLATAIRLLAADPDASMQEIAGQSGVGRTTVYRHFPTREHLLAALVDLVVTEQRAIITTATAVHAAASEVFAAIGPEIIRVGERYRFLDTRPVVVSQAPLRTPAADEPLLTWLAAAQRRGELRKDFSPAWMYAMIHGLSRAANEEVLAGRTTAEEAGILLGRTFVAAFTGSTS
ncbi:TetR/AcrR family transcriptional regulator [Amycolatopsis jejuensis]|uniref:TetR/AcrR family transcriptional regulator n=1 Tax=Amycolatopsis jejuensis TaxID=330084 RepID=UPI00138E4757|nr:TetR/AcrR family transcriptional regulator [Amycolatopsis jejuensis]